MVVVVVVEEEGIDGLTTPKSSVGNCRFRSSHSGAIPSV